MKDRGDPAKKWRLRTEDEQWTIQVGIWDDRHSKRNWTVQSVHPQLVKAIRWLFETLVREGYKAEGMSALVERIESTEAVLATLAVNIEAELEAPE